MKYIQPKENKVKEVYSLFIHNNNLLNLILIKMCCTLILIILAIFFPFVPVIYLEGLCSKDFLLNILLLMLGYIPAVMHALYLIFNRERPGRDGYSDLESQRKSDHVYQRGWDDRGRLETDNRAASPQPQHADDPKKAPPPYSEI